MEGAYGFHIAEIQRVLLRWIDSMTETETSAMKLGQ